MSAVDTRALILEAAVDLASMRGLQELSIGGLASTVEMSKSGLFAHFGSKQELQLATVTEAWDLFESQVVREPLDEQRTPLTGLIERWLDFYEREVFSGGCFFVIAAVELAGRDDPVSGVLREAVERQIAALERVTRRANESGELSPPREPEQTAVALHSLLVNAESIYQVRRDKSIFEATRATIAEFLAPPDSR